MTLLPRRFRRPRAELRITADRQAPPDSPAGGAAHLRVELLSLESFRVRRGRVELELLTTRFSRTVLDGYLEHTSGEVYWTATLCENVPATPAGLLLYSCSLLLPVAPPPDALPARQEWQARARFEVEGRRELQAARTLPDASPRRLCAPVVDGAGFLPLYEFRGEPER